MNKLLFITVLVALLAHNAESFRVSRQAEDTEGTMAKFTDSVKAYYSGAVNTASEYLEKIKGLKLEEKAKNLYTETTNVVTTYAGIMQDQIYHSMYKN
ncbi:hypothetical protein CesoFtcFv8_012362 [Champsocephalus esox]|uniref:Apolipoprotein C-II n=1 Tax=Champsocephalus esox TaxID=159716 RepID=A0AAN8BX87_9TELE|nr:hypothetical protein CesoFtcFv8_012362 [Champsocephalus esox]